MTETAGEGPGELMETRQAELGGG